MPQMPDGFYNRFNPTKNYDAHLFRAGYVLQSAELNEVQSGLADRLQRVADVLLKNGSVIRDGQLIINTDTGEVVAQSGAIYLKGAVRGIPERKFTISTTGTVVIGAYLIESVVTELEDPTLRDPAIGVRNYQEPGASRLKVVPQWGYAGEAGAPDNSEFYPVYTVVDGVVLSVEPPPQLDAVSTALARYDRESSGGYYIAEGLRVEAAEDLAGGEQVYTVSEGNARVNGQAVSQNTSRRVTYDATPDLKLVDAEPHVSTGPAAQRVDLNFSPIASITQVRIITEKTVAVTHGAYTGALDPLPDSAILLLITVSQGGTTYTQGTDYKRTGDQVDWSLVGAEPAPGSTYSVTYQYITSVTPTDADETGLTVTGAVLDSLIQITYLWKMPRWDRLCLDIAGQLTWVQGTPHAWSPAIPRIPDGLLLLASIYQNWTSRILRADGPRMVPMGELEAMNQRIDSVYALIAEQRLLTDTAISEPVSKQGVFVDPFLDDDQRDQGLVQTGAIFDGELTMSIMPNITAVRLGNDVQTLPIGDTAILIEQTLRTGFMKVNPYLAFAPIPIGVKLNPATDFWTETNVQWLSPITRKFFTGKSDSVTSTQFVRSTTTNLQYLRPITVEFTLNGFTPGETLHRLTFDEIPVSPVA